MPKIMMENIEWKDFEKVVELLGRDMSRLRKDMGTLCENQGYLLEEIKVLKETQVVRLKTLNERHANG